MNFCIINIFKSFATQLLINPLLPKCILGHMVRCGMIFCWIQVVESTEFWLILRLILGYFSGSDPKFDPFHNFLPLLSSKTICHTSAHVPTCMLEALECCANVCPTRFSELYKSSKFLIELLLRKIFKFVRQNTQYQMTFAKWGVM